MSGGNCNFMCVRERGCSRVRKSATAARVTARAAVRQGESNGVRLREGACTRGSQGVLTLTEAAYAAVTLRRSASYGPAARRLTGCWVSKGCGRANRTGLSCPPASFGAFGP